MPKQVYTPTPQLKKVHKQQEQLLQQMAEMKGDLSTLLHSIRNIEHQLSNMQRKNLKEKNAAFSPLSAISRKRKKRRLPIHCQGSVILTWFKSWNLCKALLFKK